MASLKKIWRKWRRRRGGIATAGVTQLPRRSIQNADVIITTNEVTDRHGTGVILNRIFGGSRNLLLIRSTNLYLEHSLAGQRLCLSHEGLTRAESFERVLFALNGNTIQRVLCVPFLADELISAIALKELFGVPLCTYLMDDNNVYARGIPDDLMREALSKSSLRLAISPEMRDEYEKKYSLKFWILPPVVGKDNLGQAIDLHNGDEPERVPTGVLVGSLWSRRWLERLRQTIREAGVRLHWYGNTQASWLNTNRRDLEKDGIIDFGFLPERKLTERLHQYSYAIIPSGTLETQDDRPEIARLSLPTRMPYLLAASHIPMIVMGSHQTAAARFVERFGVGCVSPYDGARLRQAIEGICQPSRQRALRQQAARHASLFQAEGFTQWIWRSLEQGEACDDRFEQVFSRDSRQIVAYLDPPAPKDLWGDLILVYQALRRMKQKGYSPDFIMDVGASSGVWSDAAHRVFPKARFILVEPLYSQYRGMNDWYFQKHPEFEYVPVAVSERPGVAELRLTEDLYGSSLFSASSQNAGNSVNVTVQTLDQVASEKRLVGRGLLKLDVQFAEHLVLRGAKEILPQLDALIVELSLFRHNPQALTFPEMYELIRGLGFRYYEDIGGWRSPVDGTTLQKDVLFVREHLFLGNNSTSARADAPPETEIRGQVRMEPAAVDA
jgi:FkbM family methyltransferase